VAKLRMAPQQQRQGDTSSYEAALRRSIGFSTRQELERKAREEAERWNVDPNLPPKERALQIWQQAKLATGIRMPAPPRQPERTPGEDDE